VEGGRARGNAKRNGPKNKEGTSRKDKKLHEKKISEGVKFVSLQCRSGSAFKPKETLLKKEGQTQEGEGGSKRGRGENTPKKKLIFGELEEMVLLSLKGEIFAKRS